jgi:ketosteroid isomerase-like protein
MSEAKLELARAGIDAWNDRDLDWLRENSTESFEFVPAVAATVEGGSVRGVDGVARFLEEVDELWESFRIEPGELEVIGETVLSRGRVIAKGRGSGLELDQPIGSLTSFEGEKISRLQSFLDLAEAVAAAERLSAERSPSEPE